MVVSCLEALKERVDVAIGEMVSRRTCHVRLVVGLSTILEIFFNLNNSIYCDGEPVLAQRVFRKVIS